jgi:hypothetical protein
MTTTLALPSSVRDRWRVVGLTVDQYEFLVEQGRLSETPTTELLDGQIVYKDRSHVGEDPMTIGVLHAWVIESLKELDADVRSTSAKGALIRVQLPVGIPPSHEPEPAGALVRGTKADYLRRHPRPSDVLCLFEAADSSLEHDRTVKLQIYAAAGMAMYVIVNVIDRVLEVHTQPTGGAYTVFERVHPGGTLVLPIGDGQTMAVPADQLIPPPLG